MDDEDLKDTSEFEVEIELADLDVDEALDEAAQGHGVNADDAPADEVDAMGRAAGIKPAAGKPFVGIEAVEGRDARRWELDPRSAERDLDEPEVPEAPDAK
jgi:hypothetical protein